MRIELERDWKPRGGIKKQIHLADFGNEGRGASIHLARGYSIAMEVFNCYTVVLLRPDVRQDQLGIANPFGNDQRR